MKWKPVLKKNYHQLIFVFIAFLLMILVSIISINAITHQKLLNASNETLRTVEANIRVNLQEPEATLVGATFTVRNMVVNQNASQEEILQYLTGLTDWVLENNERVSGFNGIYGVIRGDFLDGSGWEPSADYIPQERPWYIAAMQNTNEIVITAPYVDVQTQVPVISLSQEVQNPGNESIGVIALDVMLTRLTEYVSNLQQSYGGYGILLDSDFSVMAHPVKDFIGMPLENLSEDYLEIVAELEADASISGKTIYDTDGTRMILFFREIYNGWYVGMLTPADSYYSDMYRMETILIILGGALMLILSLFLMRLAAAKMRSDEENQLKSSFLARMSHEIRTPMNAILGMVELMLRKNLPNDVREEAVAIKQASSNLLSIIGDILDFSKIESNRMEIVAEQYKLLSLLNDVVNIIRMRVGESPVLFVVNIDCRLPSLLIGDEVRLRQILLNLLSNAVKYTRAGYVSLTVNGIFEDTDTIILSFEVADTGIGIKDEDFEILFSDFTQFDTHKNLGIEGTGLGLAIARSLCRLMNGDITVTSKYGEGSIFTARLPQRIEDPTPLAVIDHPEEHHILIYETREVYAHSIFHSVQNLGVNCTLATNYENYIEALRNGSYSFVFAAPALYDVVCGTIELTTSKAKPVLLTEFYEANIFDDVLSMSMPAYCASIANILNGVSEADMHRKTETLGIRFIAPAARILIVDDVEVNLRVVGGLLSPYKAQIDCCTNGREAIELVLKNDYDIVFMDHMMPEMDGIETVKKIRSLGGARFRTLTIIALTANAISGMREMFIENGFNDYLAKPIEIPKMNAIMHRWIPIEKHVNEVISDKNAYSHAPEKQTDVSGVSIHDIDGLDTKRGLMMMGGSEESYREVLMVFCDDVTARMDILKEVPDESGCKLFTTHVHALKSASASVGATALSERAAFLEKAGLSGDMDAIRENLDNFRMGLEALVQKIESSLAERV